MSERNCVAAGVITCTRCQQTKTLEEFRRRTDGNFHSWCIECKRTYDRLAARFRHVLETA